MNEVRARLGSFEKRLKYARVEAERRFLLAAPPAEIDPGSGYQTFEDLYFLGTTLRLRRVTSPDGAIVELKLKVTEDPRFSGDSLAAEKPEKTLVLARELLKR